MIYKAIRQCNYYLKDTFQEAGELNQGDEVDILEKHRGGYNGSIWGSFEKEGKAFDVLIRCKECQVLRVEGGKDDKSIKRSRKSAAGREAEG